MVRSDVPRFRDWGEPRIFAVTVCVAEPTLDSAAENERRFPKKRRTCTFVYFIAEHELTLMPTVQAFVAGAAVLATALLIYKTWRGDDDDDGAATPRGSAAKPTTAPKGGCTSAAGPAKGGGASDGVAPPPQRVRICVTTDTHSSMHPSSKGQGGVPERAYELGRQRQVISSLPRSQNLRQQHAAAAQATTTAGRAHQPRPPTPGVRGERHQLHSARQRRRVPGHTFLPIFSGRGGHGVHARDGLPRHVRRQPRPRPRHRQPRRAGCRTCPGAEAAELQHCAQGRSEGACGIRPPALDARPRRFTTRFRGPRGSILHDPHRSNTTRAFCSSPT